VLTHDHQELPDDCTVEELGLRHNYTITVFDELQWRARDVSWGTSRSRNLTRRRQSSATRLSPPMLSHLLHLEASMLQAPTVTVSNSVIPSTAIHGGHRRKSGPKAASACVSAVKLLHQGGSGGTCPPRLGLLMDCSLTDVAGQSSADIRCRTRTADVLGWGKGRPKHRRGLTAMTGVKTKGSSTFDYAYYKYFG
jgi:hypothetical protein